MKRIFPPPYSIRNFIHHSQSQRRRVRQQKGAIMVLTAVVMVGLIGILALAVDLGVLFGARAQLHNGINAGTLGAAAGLRATIEGDPAAPGQKNLATELARKYAGLNEVLNQAKLNANNIAVKKVDVDTSGDIPKVTVGTSLEIPLLFAGIFGLNSINLGATATASLLPVDGGTGTMSAGTGLATGCWRPLFLPDTFYNSSNVVMMVGDNATGGRVPTSSGDYYRSRFAAGARAGYPFIDGVLGDGPFVTGLRDTQLQVEIGQQTIMGQPVTFSPNFYYIADFSKLPRSTFDIYSVGDM